MRRWVYFVLTFSALNGLVFCFNNCSSSFHGGGGETSSASIDTTSAVALQAEQILSTNCASCHGSQGLGGLSNITDLAGLEAGGFVIPGDVSGSPLIAKVTMGLMPPGAPLSASDQSTLEQWVAGNSTAAPAPTPAPTPTPSPASGPSVPTATFSNISANILTVYCVSCHGATAQGNGYRFDSYAGVMQVVQAGDLGTSLLYTQVASGTMPLNGPVLSTADIEMIAAWIAAGALNN